MICIVHAFAVAPSSDPSDWGGHGPSVLGRQVPRSIVAAINGDGDRGLRFFPFLGNDGGRRCFLEADDVLPIDLLRRLHASPDAARYVVAGRLEPDRLTLHAHDRRADDEAQRIEIPFDPTDPFAAVQRAVFELAAPLGLGRSLPPVPKLSGDDAVRFLHARDVLLALEARLLGVDAAGGLRAAHDLFVRGVDPPNSGALLVELGAVMLRQAESVEVVRDLVADAIDRPGVSDALLMRASSLLEAAGDPMAATGLAVRAARARPENVSAVLQSAAALFAQERYGEAKAILCGALAVGVRDPRVRAQLAACEELSGDLAARDRLLAELLQETGPSADAAVQRILVSWLVDAGRFEDAKARVEAALAVHPGHAGLWLEAGRVALGRGEPALARDALTRCLDCGPSAEGRSEARRLLQLARDDALLPEVVTVEELLAAGDASAARRVTQRLVVERSTLPEAWLLHGMVLHRLGRRRAATRALERALQLRPDFAEAHNRLGILLAERGRDDAAWEHVQQAVELAPGDASAWVHFAQVAARVGDLPAARAALRRVELLGEHAAVVEELRRRLA